MDRVYSKGVKIVKMWTWRWTLIVIIIMAITICLGVSYDREQLEKDKLIAWAEKQGLTKDLYSKEGNLILEEERTDLVKMKEYRDKCDPSPNQPPKNTPECHQLYHQIIIKLEDMKLPILIHYFGKRKKFIDEL